MRKIYPALLVLIFAPLAVIAQQIPAIVSSPEITDENFFQALMQSLNGFKGASAMAIAAIITQLIVALLKAPIAHELFNNLLGKYRLLIVSGVSIIAGVLSLKVAGVDWLAALSHSFTLTSFQVFGNQVVKQVKKES